MRLEQKDATIAEKEQRLRQCREELTQQIQQIQQQNQQLSQQIRQLEIDKRQIEREKQEIIQQMEQKREQAIQWQGQIYQRLAMEESEQSIAVSRSCEEQISELRSQIQKEDAGGAKAGAVNKTSFNLRWRKGKEAPFDIHRSCDAAVGNSMVYCKYKNSVNAYHIPSSSWFMNPTWSSCSWNGFAITVIDGILTTVGGYRDDGKKDTNKLLSLTREGRWWTEKFPPMPTKRYAVSVLCTGTALIVAGGVNDKIRPLRAVEVLNTETQQWRIAPDLPQSLSESSLTLCGDLVYLLGGYNEDGATNLVYSCRLSSLLSTGSKSLGGRLVSTLTRSSKSRVWNRIADLPVKDSTAVTLNDRLLAIGGEDSEGQPTTAVHVYYSATNSWEIVSHMTIPRTQCLAAVLPDSQLMVVGGYTTGGKRYDSIELGRMIL